MNDLSSIYKSRFSNTGLKSESVWKSSAKISFRKSPAEIRRSRFWRVVGEFINNINAAQKYGWTES